MKLYYTVSSGEDDVQAKPNLSLGGYKSLNQITNSIFGNLFSDISMYTVKNNITNTYIGLILVNDAAVTVHDVKMWFVYNTGCVSILRGGAVDLAEDEDGHKYMEIIAGVTSKPLYVTLAEADGIANAIDIGDMNAGDMVGIWLEREVDLEEVSDQQEDVYQVDPTDPYRYLPKDVETEDEIEIKFSYVVDPILVAIGDKTAISGNELTFTTTVTDPDSSTKTFVYTIDSAAQTLGMSITTGGVFTWTPTVGQSGASYEVTVTVTDNFGLSDSETIEITVS